LRDFLRFLFYDYKAKWGNKSTIAIFIALPVIMSLLMTIVFGRGDKKISFQPPKIALVNRDNGFLSKGLVKFLTNDEMKKEFVFVETDYKAGFKGMKNQVYSAIVVLPENFTRDFFYEKSPSILLIKNPSQGIYPKMVETMLSLMTEGVNYLLTYYYPQFKEVSEIYRAVEGKRIILRFSFLNFKKLKDVGIDFYNKSKKLINVVKEQSFTVDFKEEKEKNKKTGFIGSLFPAYSLFFLLFFANIMAVSIVKENSESISKRLMLTGLSSLKYLLVKVLSSVMFLLTISFVFILSGYFIFKIKTEFVFLLIAIVVLSCFALFSVFFLISSFSKNEASASNLGMVVLFLMGFTGGGMIPLNFIPSFLVSISKIFPFYRLNILFIELLGNLKFRVDYVLYCIVFSIVCYALGFFFFRKNLLKGEV